MAKRVEQKALFVYCDPPLIELFSRARNSAGRSKSDLLRRAIEAYSDAVLELNGHINQERAVQDLVKNHSNLKELKPNAN